MKVSEKIGSQEVCATCGSQYIHVAEQILDMIKQQAENGARVFEGMTIRFGWTTFMLRRVKNALYLHEPDFDKNPLTSARRNIDCSIDVYLKQQSVIAELGLPTWTPAHCFETILAAHGSLEETSLVAKHYLDKKGERGWVVFHPTKQQELTAENMSEQYGQVPVWQLLHTRPELLPYLALPTGFTVFLRDGVAQRIINDEGDCWD